MKLKTGIFFLGLLSIISCQKEIDVNAPYEDVTVVYGILNQKENIHYIKINKAFLGPADVSQMAQVKDSSEYNPIDIIALIKEVGGENRTFTLRDTIITNKESGFFYGPEQTIYYFSTTSQNPLIMDAKYKLEITNKKNNKEITAETKLISSFSSKLESAYNIAFVNYKGEYSAKKVNWNSPVNGKRYDVKMIFNYYEKFLNGDTILGKPIEWMVKGIKSSSTTGNQSLEVSFEGESFFSEIANGIPDKSDVERWVYSLDFYIYAAGEELNEYMELKEPTSSIIQEKPEYSNLTNAIGVFSSRYYESYEGKTIERETAKFLKSSLLTKSKNFTKFFVKIPTAQYWEDLP